METVYVKLDYKTIAELEFMLSYYPSAVKSVKESFKGVFDECKREDGTLSLSKALSLTTKAPVYLNILKFYTLNIEKQDVCLSDSEWLKLNRATVDAVNKGVEISYADYFRKKNEK